MSPSARLLVAVAALGLFACHRGSVHQEDLDSWRDAPVEALETHPVFAALPLDKRPLSDGSELWTFRDCSTRPSSVVTNQYGTVVLPGRTRCCSNEFLTRDGVVEEYRAVGHCQTGEYVRPR